MGKPVPIMIDGKRYPSKLAACVEIRCTEAQVTYALKNSGAIYGRKVSVAPDGPVLVHHNTRIEPVPRSTTALLPTLCTHRLGAYRGEPV